MADIELDIKRLKRDVTKRQADRPTGVISGGRRATGSMAIVRQHLAHLDALRAEGATWAEIAAGLAEQGVTQGEGAPLTAKRLTALVTLVRRAAAKRVAKIAERQARADTVKSETGSGGRLKAGPKLTLSPELMPSSEKTADPIITEGELRRMSFDRHAHLFKKD